MKPLPYRALFIKYRWHLLAIIALVFVHGAAHADEANTKQVEVAIPATVQALFDKADVDIAKVNAALVEKLKKAEADAAKKNNLDLAVWIQKRIEGLQPKKETPAPEPVNILGTYLFDFHTGHQGVLQITKGEASEEGIHGTIAIVGATWDITWANHTHWVISQVDDGQLSVSANDGTSVLVQQGRHKDQ